MKYLITGLGNIGEQYAQTRHNIGFDILDALAGAYNGSFTDRKYGRISELKWKGRIFLLLKPSTFVNLSGKAVNFYLAKHKIAIENLLVVTDDISLPFGTIRIRPSGGDAGHNGLISIIETLGTQKFARLRFGIGSDFPRGYQVQHVLGTWSEEEKASIPELLLKSGNAILSFGTIGMERTMTLFNNK